MAITISNAYIQTFERTVRQLAQQSITRLRAYVTEKGVESSKHNWDRLGKGDFATKAAARTATPATDSPWSRRAW